MSIILASASPRRAELLAQIGLQFSVKPADIDESRFKDEDPSDYVMRLSKEKALALGRTDAVVLAADTVVVIDQEVLGKPKNRAGGLSMLMRLSGRDHEVLTGISVMRGDLLVSRVVSSIVTFKLIDQDFAEKYWATGEPRDKAGSYGIQGLGAIFVAHLVGSYSNVMGLPLFETASLLSEAGVVIL